MAAPFVSAMACQIFWPESFVKFQIGISHNLFRWRRFGCANPWKEGIETDIIDKATSNLTASVITAREPIGPANAISNGLGVDCFAESFGNQFLWNNRILGFRVDRKGFIINKDCFGIQCPFLVIVGEK